MSFLHWHSCLPSVNSLNTWRSFYNLVWIVSVHCQEEGCIGLRPRDFPRSERTWNPIELQFNANVTLWLKPMWVKSLASWKMKLVQSWKHILRKDWLLHTDQVDVNVVAVGCLGAPSPNTNLKTLSRLPTIVLFSTDSILVTFLLILSMAKVGWFTSVPVVRFQLWTSKQSPRLFLCPASHSHMPHLFKLLIKSTPKIDKTSHNHEFSPAPVPSF